MGGGGTGANVETIVEVVMVVIMVAVAVVEQVGRYDQQRGDHSSRWGAARVQLNS